MNLINDLPRIRARTQAAPPSTARSVILQLVDRVEQLQEALNEYGRHLNHCPLTAQYRYGKRGFKGDPNALQCVCGLDSLRNTGNPAPKPEPKD